MTTLIDQQLSSELQELYLQNKQWYSDVLFLEDETAFFQKLFGSVLSTVAKEKLSTPLAPKNPPKRGAGCRLKSRESKKNLTTCESVPSKLTC